MGKRVPGWLGVLLGMGVLALAAWVTRSREPLGALQPDAETDAASSERASEAPRASVTDSTAAEATARQATTDRAPAPSPAASAPNRDATEPFVLRLVDEVTREGIPNAHFEYEASGVTHEVRTDARGEVSISLPARERWISVAPSAEPLRGGVLQPVLTSGYPDVDHESGVVEVEARVPWAVLQVAYVGDVDAVLEASEPVRLEVDVDEPAWLLEPEDMLDPPLLRGVPGAYVAVACDDDAAAPEAFLVATRKGVPVSPCASVALGPGLKRITLPLGPPAELVVLVRGEDGLELPPLRVEIRSEVGRWSGYALSSNPASSRPTCGDSPFRARLPFDTPVRLRVLDYESYWAVAAGRVTLAAGEVRTLELEVARNALPRRLASGVVLDERGEPLADQVIVLQAHDGSNRTGGTDEEGRFELWGELPSGGGELFVAPRSETACPALAFERLPVADVVLRRRRAPRRVELTFDVEAEEGGPGLEDPCVFVAARGPGEDRWKLVATNWHGGGAVSLDVLDDVEYRWVVEQHGYAWADGPLSQALLATEEPSVRVRLVPGFSATFVVVDERSGRPIGGAVARAPGGAVLGTSTSSGELELRAEGPVEEVSIEAKGYDPTWVVPEVNDHWGNEVWMERALPVPE
ncbi:MAG: hypothetical protein H6828_13135 [Planctomycetes bacterium]|nr:hypothetical protein [Planctomycetota bacterium]